MPVLVPLSIADIQSFKAVSKFVKHDLPLMKPSWLAGF